MLYVDKRGIAAVFLPLRDAVQRERRFTGGFRPVHLYNTPSGQAADSQRHIQRKRTGGDRFHLHCLILSQAHNGALAKLLFNLRQRRIQRLAFIHCHGKTPPLQNCNHRSAKKCAAALRPIHQTGPPNRREPAATHSPALSTMLCANGTRRLPPGKT